MVNDVMLEILESLMFGCLSCVLIDSVGEFVGWIGIIFHSGGRVWEIYLIVVVIVH